MVFHPQIPLKNFAAIPHDTYLDEYALDGSSSTFYLHDAI